MMYGEFLEISGLDITFKQYNEIIEPMYNAVESMSKQEFVKFITPSAKVLEKQNKAEKVKAQKLVFIGDGSKTPNGCYYIGVWAKLVDVEVSIATGKITYKVRELTDEEYIETARHHSLETAYSVDVNTFLHKVIWVK